MLEKRVETISDDYWTKWIEDFRIQQENELQIQIEKNGLVVTQFLPCNVINR